MVIVEIGGTVGDIESLPFMEAIRQFSIEEGSKNVLFIHLTLVPHIDSANELKTKPTQHSVMRLREIGVQPDMLLCRTDRELPDMVRQKLALFCNVKEKNVIEARDVSLIYEVPLLYAREGFDNLVTNHFQLKTKEPDLKQWKKTINKYNRSSENITIAICGKYVKLPDAYKSIIESFIHAGIENNVRVTLKWINTEKIVEGNEKKHLGDITGILVPGGFGERGIEGKLRTIKFARENNIPFFGICLGLQCAVIEFARNIIGWKTANSLEFNKKSPYPVIAYMEEQLKVTQKGGTMRLGAYKCKLKTDTLAYNAYQKSMINERHRHRFEVNNQYRKILVENGLVISGTSPDNSLVEMIELKDHPWFVGCQFHPELKSRATRAHPLFRDFVKASINYYRN